MPLNNQGNISLNYRNEGLLFRLTFFLKTCDKYNCFEKKECDND